jgi:lambda family phage tail tape measure protein
MGAITNPTNSKEIRRAALEAQIWAKTVQMRAQLAGGFIADAIRTSVEAGRMSANLKSGNYYTGGYTGRGGKYEPAGVVHRGEYVVPKKDVNQRTGLPYADAMGRLQRGASGPGYAGGGFVRGGAAMAGIAQIGSLGPMAQQQFAQLFAQYMRVYLDGNVIARSSADQYSDQTAVGAY